MVLTVWLSGLLLMMLPSGTLAEDLRQNSPQPVAAAKARDGTIARLQNAATLAWQRLNRAAMNSVRIPPEMPGLLARILTLSTTEYDAERLQLLSAALEGYQAELDMIEYEPDKLGLLSTSVTGPFSAGSWQKIVQVYTVGSAPIGPGGGLLITSHWSTPLLFQATNPDLANFIRVSSDNPGVSFEFKRMWRGGIHGGLEKAAEVLLLEVADGELQPGQTVQIEYGGTRGVQVPTRSTDGFSLPVYVRLVGDGHFNSLTQPTFRILGESVQSISIVAPSVVKAGQPFSVYITGRDRFGNKASGLIPSLEILVNDTYYTRIESGYDALGRIENLVIEQPGVYTIGVRSSGGGISARGNPIEVVTDLRREILWGELGKPTDMSIGQGSLDYELRVASNENHLDFISIADRDSLLDDWEWERLLDTAEQFTAGREIRVFPGFLRFLPTEKGGSQTLIFPAGKKMPRISQQETPRLVEFYQQMRGRYLPRDVVVVPNTESAGDWRFIDPGFVSLVEIKTAKGFFEWYGQQYLDRGNRLGFAASNDLSQEPENLFPGGLTAAIVDPASTEDRFSQTALFDALKSGRTYVTSGNRMILNFRVNGGRIGDRVQGAIERHVSGEIRGTGPLEWVEVIRNGLPVWRKPFYLPNEIARSANELWVKIEFSSGSMPGNNQIASPAPAREWIGFVSTSSGGFTRLTTPALSSSEQRQAIINPTNSRRIDFITQTRGNESGFSAKLDGVTEDLVFDISILGNETAPGLDDAGGELAEPSVTHQKVSLIELNKGSVTRDIRENGLHGQFSLEIVEPSVEDTLTFDFTDTGEREAADYYYLRVKQQDGNYGWSSPIWIGGFDLE